MQRKSTWRIALAFPIALGTLVVLGGCHDDHDHGHDRDIDHPHDDHVYVGPEVHRDDHGPDQHDDHP